MKAHGASMKNKMKKALAAVLLLVPATAWSAAVDTAAIEQGDIADIRFICRLANGEVAAASDNSATDRSGIRKSAVFMSRGQDGPLPIKAAASVPAQPEGKEKAFEWEIVDRLAVALAGMKEGESRNLKIESENLPERSKEDYSVRIARVRERLKETKMTVDEYQYRTGKAPVVGEPFVLDPTVPGRVEKVAGEEVVLHFTAKDGEKVETPFGPGRIKESEKAYEIEIDAKAGELVRSGPFVGRIEAVDDKSITIDYRHPFGGEALSCEVTVEKITKEKAAESKPAGKGAGE